MHILYISEFFSLSVHILKIANDSFIQASQGAIGILKTVRAPICALLPYKSWNRIEFNRVIRYIQYILKRYNIGAPKMCTFLAVRKELNGPSPGLAIHWKL